MTAFRFDATEISLAPCLINVPVGPGNDLKIVGFAFDESDTENCVA
jgi:hypothetical protein